MDRVLWELRPRERRYGVLCSTLGKMDGFIYGPERSYGRRLYVVHCSPAHRKLRSAFREFGDYYLAFIHQVTGKDIENYPYTYMQPKSRRVRSLNPHWSGPSCPGGKEAGPHGLRSESTAEVRYRELPDMDVFKADTAGLVLASQAARASYESSTLSGLTFSPCLDIDAEGQEPQWYVVEASYSSATFVNDTPTELLAFCDGCGRYFGVSSRLLLEGNLQGVAFTYLDAGTLEPLDFQIPRYTRIPSGRVENIPRQDSIVVGRRGREWLQRMRGGCGTILRRPLVTHWVVETAPESRHCDSWAGGTPPAGGDG